MIDFLTQLKESASTAKPKTMIEKVKKIHKPKPFYPLQFHYDRSIRGIRIVAYNEQIEQAVKIAYNLDIPRVIVQSYSGKWIQNMRKRDSYITTPILENGKSKCIVSIKIRSLDLRQASQLVSMIREFGAHEYANAKTIIRRLVRERIKLLLPHNNVRAQDGGTNKAAISKVIGMTLKKVSTNKSYKIVAYKDNTLFYATDENPDKEIPLQTNVSNVFNILDDYEIDAESKRSIISTLFGRHSVEGRKLTVESGFQSELDRNIQRLQNESIDLWDCQIRAAAKICLKKYGVLHARMGLGKSRMYPAICKCYGGKHHLLLTEPQLLNELIVELEAVNIKPFVIKSTSDLKKIQEFNVATYTTLQRKSDHVKVVEKKMNKTKSTGKTKSDSNDKMLPYKTLADDMKSIKWDTVIIDECHNIKNHLSLRYKYMCKLKFKHIVLGSGTVIGNTFGDYASYMSYILHGDKLYGKEDIPSSYDYGKRDYSVLAHLEKIKGKDIDSKLDIIFGQTREQSIVENLVECISYNILDRKISSRNNNYTGVMPYGSHYSEDLHIDLNIRDQFRNELCGNRYTISDFQEVYDLVTVNMRHDHPEVLADVQMPTHEERIVNIKPTMEHILAYRKAIEQLEEDFKKDDSVTMFQAIRRLIEACDVPQKLGISNASPKQEAVAKSIVSLCERGDKVICFTTFPLMTKTIESLLVDIPGVNVSTLYSEMSIDKRNKTIDAFRHGTKNVLISTYSLCCRGYNLHQANIVIEASQTWSAYDRAQAMARIIRPQQKKHPIVLRFKTTGMIDDYMISNSIIKESNMERIPDGIDKELSKTGPTNVEQVIRNVMQMINMTGDIITKRKVSR